MALYAFVIVALYPAFKNETSLDRFAKDSATIAALFGVSGSLTSPSGWLNANLYSNFVPLIMLLVTIGYGASCLAGQHEDGTLGMVATLALSRRRIAVEKLAAMALQALPVAVITALCSAAGRWFDLSTDLTNLGGITLGVVLLGVDFGALAMLIGAVSGSRGSALGITSGVAALAYLLNSLAPVISWLHRARFASPFYYAVGNSQLVNGLSVGDGLALAGVALVLGAAAVVAFERLDIN